MSGLRGVAGREDWRPARAIAVCALALAAVPLGAQQLQPASGAAQEPPPHTVQQDTQQPGAGAQLHTGTKSGLDADARLRNLLADHQFLLLESQLDKMPPEQAQFYRGILANRNNDAKASIEALEPLVDRVTAEDYLRVGDWAKAAKAYQTFFSRMEGKLSADERDEIEMPLKLLPLAAANPPMTVEPCDPFVLQVSKNPLGLTDIPVFVDGRSHTWMLDPTAPFNLISRSLAKEVGLKVSDEAATIHTLTGRPIQVHAAVVPRFTIGGRLTLRNMTVFVYEDADYFFPASHYQVEGVLGYPALSALGSLTITADATIKVRPTAQIEPPDKDDRLTSGARFFLDGDQVIVALGNAGAAGGSQERMFAIDAGGQQSYFTSRYYEEHSGDFTGQKMELFAIPGSQSLPPQPAYIAETLPLPVGATTVHIHYVQVLTQPLGEAALDDVYGFLGVDVLDQLRSYTFDYRTMHFTVSPE
jgi:hypothetical protein